jgi:hypothetical protein
MLCGHAIAWLVEAICYKLEGRRFEPRMRWISSMDLYTIGRTPWTSVRPFARSLPKYKINAYTYQTSMP